MAVQDGGRAAAVAVVELSEVVPDGDELDALPPRGGRQLGELGERGTVAGLVQAHQQPWVEHAVRLTGGQLLGVADDDADQQLEQRAEPALLVGGGVQVQGVGATKERVDVQVAALSTGGDDRVGEHVQQRLGRSVDAPQRIVGPRLARRPGVQGHPVAGGLQRLGDLVLLLDVDPAGDIGHGPVAACRREQQHSEELGAE